MMIRSGIRTLVGYWWRSEIWCELFHRQHWTVIARETFEQGGTVWCARCKRERTMTSQEDTVW